MQRVRDAAGFPHPRPGGPSGGARFSLCGFFPGTSCPYHQEPTPVSLPSQRSGRGGPGRGGPTTLVEKPLSPALPMNRSGTSAPRLSLSPRGTSGERAGERGRPANSAPPLPGPLLPPASGGEGEAAPVRFMGSKREVSFRRILSPLVPRGAREKPGRKPVLISMVMEQGRGAKREAIGKLLLWVKARTRALKTRPKSRV